MVGWLEGFYKKGTLKNITGVYNEDYPELMSALTELEDAETRKALLKQKYQGVYVVALELMERNEELEAYTEECKS